MLDHTTVEDCLEVEEYLDEMIEYYQYTHNPLMVERRKTYKDIKIALLGENLDNGDTGNKNTRAWFC
jgi:hypothetical protein